MARSAQVGWLAVACVGVLLAYAGAAVADDSATTAADRLFQQGRRAADRGDYAEACQRFEESFRLDPAIGTLVNLGDCEENLGELDRAVVYFRTALSRMAPGDDRMPHVLQRLAGIDEKAARLTIKLASDAPQGTVITVDGNVVNPKKSPFFLAKGVHPVLVTAVGYRGARYNVGMMEGATRTLEVSPGTPLETVLPTEIGTASLQSTSHATWPKPMGIAFVGLGVASVWVASLAGVEAIDRRDVQRDNCTAQNICNQAGVDAAHAGASWATVSTVSFVAGGVLLTAGVMMVILSLTHHSAQAAWDVSRVAF